MSLESAVRTSQDHQEDVSGGPKLAKICCIIGETVRIQEATYRKT